MLDNQHETVFPPSGNVTIWRYTDLAKLLSLLEYSQLHFARADQFDDPYEGALSRAGVALLRQEADEHQIPTDAVDRLIAQSAVYRKCVYLSCWHTSEYESAAMWKLYMQSNEGVSIRTDYNSLCAALEDSPLSIRTTMVQYIAYESTAIPMSNVLFPFVHKRLSFAHENELRAIIWADEDVNRSKMPTETTSVCVNVDPQRLIKAVHVSPHAPAWFGSLVEQLMRRYKLKVPIIRSSLYERPAY